MQFIRRTLVGLMLIAVTVALLAAAANSFRSAIEDRMSREERRRPARERVAAVNTVAIEPGQVQPELRAFGEVLSRRNLELRASAGGRVVFLAENFEDGAMVAAGDLLVRIDPTNAQGALDVARTDLSEAEAELRDAERNLELATDELAAAQAQADLRSQALLRQQDLAQRGVGTAAAVEAAQLSEAGAVQSVHTRRIAVANAEGRIDQARNALSRSQIALENAERTLEDTEVRAAFDGALADVDVVAGGIVTLNEQVATLIDPDRLEVAFRVSTPQFARLLDGSGQPTNAPVTVTLDVLGLDLLASGQISRVGATVGEGQTGRLLFATLESAAAGFRPGDFVRVAVQEPALDNVARIPATAIDAANTVLAINEESRLDRVIVELLRRQGDDVLVRAPDLTGRRIVAERTPLLGAGIRVRDLTAERAPQIAGPSGETRQPQGQGQGDRITLTPERRAKLIAAVEGNNRMPAEAKERVLSQLRKDTVPARMVARIEERMGG